MKKTILSILVLALVVAALVFLSKKSPAPKDISTTPVEISGEEIDFSSITELSMIIFGEGEGEVIASGQTAVVHYAGFFTDGTVFDTSLTAGVPFEFVLGTGSVIPAWEYGVMGMKVGEKRRLVVPPAYGYGDKEVGPIPANSTLVFDIELLEIK